MPLDKMLPGQNVSGQNVPWTKYPPPEKLQHKMPPDILPPPVTRQDIKQESLADAKVSTRQQCVYEGLAKKSTVNQRHATSYFRLRDIFAYRGWKSSFSPTVFQESRPVAREPRDAAAVVFGSKKFAENIHYKFKSTHASKARLQSSKCTGAKQNLTQNGHSRSRVLESVERR